MNEPMTPDDLADILKREYEAADDYHEQLEPLQEAAFRYYEAQPFGNETDGRSQIVLPDVQETLDAMLGIILKMFVSGDRVVEFEATSEEDEQGADDATAALDYKFMREQDGYRVLNDVGMDGLQRKYGIFKSTAVEDEKVSREWVEIADELQLGMIEGEIENLREMPMGVDEMGQPVMGYRALVKRQTTEKLYTIVGVPTAEFRFTPTAAHEDDSYYLAHVRPVSRSELVEMGFDQDQVYNLPTYSRALDDRHESNTLDHYENEESTEALERVLLCEEYAHIDVDGDGIAELVKCFRVENEILRWSADESGELDEYGDPTAAQGEPAIETVDEQPFSVWCPFPRQHRLVGYSLADKTMDVQYLRSHFARQLIDGMAFANMPRPYVDMSQASDETLDDILNPIPGSPVRGNGPSTVTNLSTGFNIGDSLQAMEWVSREKEGRSGVGRATPTLDENTLNNQTATEFAGREGKAETHQEYIARNLAEALGRAFGKLYRLMRVEAEPFQIRVDGKYREVDPSAWPEKTNIRVRVGLGSNSKQKIVQGLSILANYIPLSIEAGFAGHEHAFNLQDKLARALDIGQGEDFMFDPDDPEVQQRMAEKGEQPDPEELEAQAEAARKERELALKEAETQGRLQIEQFKAQSNAELQERKQTHEMTMAEQRAVFEASLAERKAEWEAQHKANMNDNRQGGRLDR